MSQSSPAQKATTPRPNHQKAMSSRLLTMKFMQRAAASSPVGPNSPGSPGTPDPSNKRQTTDATGSPLAFNVNELADQKAVRDALEAEEKRTQAALDKAARDAGDTRWVLNFEEKTKQQNTGAMRVQQMSYANIDREAPVIRSMDAEEGDKPIGGGRRSFGKFNRKLEKLQDPDASSSEESSDEEEEEKNDFESSDEDVDDPTNQLIKTERDAAARRMKEERKAKRKADKKELARLAASRKKNEVNLNSLSSISGGGQAGGSGGGNSGPCFGCGKEGHQARDCPNKKRSRGGDDHYAGQRNDNKNKKARKSY